ncbi:MAG: hypothetical protein HKN58_07290 [Xanthomonadales bacterium]|nr:hypothetical protein [Xanthomonadales bacterium]
MKPWHKLDLGDAVLAESRAEQVRSQLAQGAEPAPCGCVFTLHQTEGGVHCRLHLYFCPDAADLARQFDAIECRPPPPGELGLLIGPPDAWTRHFPGSPQSRARNAKP